jgi:hypothetical protein
MDPGESSRQQEADTQQEERRRQLAKMERIHQELYQAWKDKDNTQRYVNDLYNTNMINADQHDNAHFHIMQSFNDKTERIKRGEN